MNLMNTPLWKYYASKKTLNGHKYGTHGWYEEYIAKGGDRQIAIRSLMKSFKIPLTRCDDNLNNYTVADAYNQSLGEDAAVCISKVAMSSMEQRGDEFKGKKLIPKCYDGRKKEFYCQCFICEKKFQFKRRLILHIKRDHGDDGSDADEKLQFRGKYHRTRGKSCKPKRKCNQMRLKNPPKCMECKEVFTSCHSLNRHKLSRHLSIEHKCEFCNLAFKRIDNLKVHKRTHTGERPFQCGHCNEAFVSKVKMRRHIALHMETYKCKYCGVCYVTIYLLKQHNRIHTKEKPYKCKYCDRAFASLSNIKQHESIHTGRKPHSCKFCNAAFITTTALKVHTRKHTGEKPYKCKYCDARFSWSVNCDVHQRSHTGERPHKCDQCPSAFHAANNLKRHKKFVHQKGPRPYRCDQCGLSYKETSSLKFHKRRVHDSEEFYDCAKCQKRFADKFSLRRHINHTRVCKNRKIVYW